MNGSLYNEDYYEHGVEKGISGYTDFKWMPELTLPLAMAYIDRLGITKEHKVLDFGCAKGFVVKALRMLNRQAWGCDISAYAVNSADNTTRQFLRISDGCTSDTFDINFDFIISKDIFEHIPEEHIDALLADLRNTGHKLLAIIPLGDSDGNFIIPSYHLDKTHVLIKNKDWWMSTFKRVGYTVEYFSHCVDDVKGNWSNFDKGNGVFLLS